MNSRMNVSTPPALTLLIIIRNKTINIHIFSVVYGGIKNNANTT